MESIDKEVEEFAELLKAIGHPIRLCIVRGLLDHSCNVTRMQECMAIAQSTVSKHIGILKAQGIIKGERRGPEIIYSLVNEDVKKIVRVLLERQGDQATEKV